MFTYMRIDLIIRNNTYYMKLHEANSRIFSFAVSNRSKKNIARATLKKYVCI
jgi:hypothetical protein